MDNLTLDELVQLERVAYANQDTSHKWIAALLDAKREIHRLTDLLDEVGVVA